MADPRGEVPPTTYTPDHLRYVVTSRTTGWLRLTYSPQEPRPEQTETSE